MKSNNNSIFKRSRGQAALEFMMTYGWAILVVLAAIGALSYFGVLNPSKFIPDTCLASAPFSCPGKPTTLSPTATLATGNLTFSLVNGQGYNVQLAGVANSVLLSGSLVGCTNVYLCAQGDITCITTVQTIPAGQGISVRAIGCPFANLNIVKGDIIFNHTNPDSRLQEQVLVSITSKPR